MAKLGSNRRGAIAGKSRTEQSIERRSRTSKSTAPSTGYTLMAVSKMRDGEARLPWREISTERDSS
jgi:hypothetical protein